jgi:peptidoglycan/xylan/chitin deacetylase (PgdA/CDA1 family)
MILELGYAGAFTAAGILTYAVRGRSATLLAPSFWRGPRDKKALALTFDDGPSAGTRELVELLGKHKALATFFLIGRNVERLPEIAREIAAAGHELANHSYSHAPFYLRHPQFLDDEILLAQEAIGARTGVTCSLFRAPYGARWFGLKQAQQRHQLTGVMWSVNSLDWKSDATSIHRRLKARVHNGAILLLHDGRELEPKPDVTATIEAVRRLLPELIDQGYHLCTVSELLCLKPQPNG